MPETQEQFPAIQPWMACMPETQEQFPAIQPWMACMPETQEQFPAIQANVSTVLACSRVAANVMVGQRSIVNCRLTRVGAR